MATGQGVDVAPNLVTVKLGADGKVKARFSGEIEPADLQAIVDDALAS